MRKIATRPMSLRENELWQPLSLNSGYYSSTIGLYKYIPLSVKTLIRAYTVRLQSAIKKNDISKVNLADNFASHVELSRIET